MKVEIKEVIRIREEREKKKEKKIILIKSGSIEQKWKIMGKKKELRERKKRISKNLTKRKKGKMSAKENSKERGR